MESRSATGVEVNEIGRELLLLTWSDRVTAAAGLAAETAYTGLARTLAERRGVALQERVFCDLRQAPAIAAARERALSGSSESWPVPPTYIEGSPAAGSGLAGIHLLAARGEARPLVESDRVYGALVETESARLLGLSDVGRRAAGRLAAGPAEEAGAAIDAAEELLAREGFSFRDVARTWFYLRDILDWYGPFNAVRNAAFRRLGLLGSNGSSPIPASTGIEGRNARGGWCTLDLLALQAKPGRSCELKRLHSRKQNEATEYGSAFARGMEIVVGDARYVFVSGTASIDEQGASVHAGDFETQTIYTLEAVRSLLESAGATLADVKQGTAFIKNPCDSRSFNRIVERSGLDAVPLVTTVADVCRPELLFEIDATAVVPLRVGRR